MVKKKPFSFFLWKMCFPMPLVPPLGKSFQTFSWTWFIFNLDLEWTPNGSLMEPEKVRELMGGGIIEITPLAYMRGRTLNNSFVILDEAQNSTKEQMKMFLTRLGFNSKMVITGDITQIDLDHSKISGLVQVRTLLNNIEGIRFVNFSEKDVVRHDLVKQIIEAYSQNGSGN